MESTCGVRSLVGGAGGEWIVDDYVLLTFSFQVRILPNENSNYKNIRKHCYDSIILVFLIIQRTVSVFLLVFVYFGKYTNFLVFNVKPV